MTNKVLIGKVKNELQLKVNLEEKFYHIPEAVMPKNMLPVGYVLYGGKNGGGAGGLHPLFRKGDKNRACTAGGNNLASVGEQRQKIL